jgi:replicative DNA helicase
MNNNLLPTNIEAEEGILTSILLDPSAISRVAECLSPEAFFVTAHSLIYKVALDLYYQDKPTDLMSVSTWLSDHKLLRKVGGQSKLSQLVERNISTANIDYYANLVLDKYKRRQLIAASNEIANLAYDTAIQVEEVFEQSEEKILNITTNKQEQFHPEIIATCLASIWKNLEEGSPPAYSTGISKLNALINGLTKKDLIIIAARASMGKTWLACHLANYIVIEQSLPVVFFSTEMSKEQLTKRLLAMHSGIDSNRLAQNEIYEDEYNALAKGLDTLRKLPIIIDDTPASNLNITKIRSVLRRIRYEKGELGLIVLDYIQKLGDRAAGNRAQALGKFSGAFKDIAKEFNVPFIALAQINRGVENQINKRPTIADIKDSGDIEQDMDIGLLLYRDEYYDPKTKDKGVMEIIVGKYRNGTTGACKVIFDPRYGKFSNASV